MAIYSWVLRYLGVIIQFSVHLQQDFCNVYDYHCFPFHTAIPPALYGVPR